MLKVSDGYTWAHYTTLSSFVNIQRFSTLKINYNIYEWYSMIHAYERNQKHSLWLLRSQPKIDHTEADLGTLDNRVKFLNPYTNRQASIPTRIRIIFNSLIINLLVILSKKKSYGLKESFLVNNMVEDIPGKKF